MGTKNLSRIAGCISGRHGMCNRTVEHVAAFSELSLAVCWQERLSGVAPLM